jgi:glycosyltransferase involved in cell wall biosynthesis
MRFLFVKETLTWPRSTGHDVHCFHLMQAMGKFGHEVSLATVIEPIPGAIDSLSLAHRFTLNDDHGSTNFLGASRLSYLQERFRSYWGVPTDHIKSVARAAADSRADVVISVGLNGLPYLGGVRDAIRVWYAADEWVLHHLAVTRWKQPATWGHFRAAAVKGLYERAYAPHCDRIWVVSSGDRRAMRWITGVNSVDALYSGVDSDYYCPGDEEELKQSCVFWGRLDFDPNIQALQWFCRNVWPLLRQQEQAARFRILGFQPGPEVRELSDGDGISLQPNLPDIRGEIAGHAVVVLPFQTSGGVKDKLLEAASMGKPIVCTRQACGGLRGLGGSPLILARRPDEWAAKILALWTDKNRRRRIGQDARNWVLRNHTWKAMAQEAVAILEQHRRS